MKTHELSKALTHLSRVLRAGPNIDLEELSNLAMHASHSRPSKPARDVAERKDASEQGAGLALLAQMASYSKPEMLELVQLLGIPIEVRKADAVRDILGKALKVIQDNPEVRDRIMRGVVHSPPGTSTSTLAKALAILMNQP